MERGLEIKSASSFQEAIHSDRTLGILKYLMPQPSHQTHANFEVKSRLIGDGEADGPDLEQKKRENGDGACT